MWYSIRPLCRDSADMQCREGEMEMRMEMRPGRWHAQQPPQVEHGWASRSDRWEWEDWKDGRGEGSGEGRSCRRHLGRNSPLALQLRLVLLERLLPTALQVLALMVLRHAVL